MPEAKPAEAAPAATQEAGSRSDRSRRPNAAFSGKLGVRILLAALLLVFVVVTWIVMSVPADRNELGLIGEIEIQAASDTIIYIGQQKLGSGTVAYSWNDLLGVSGRQAAAVPGADVDQLAGPGATLVWSQPGQPDAYRGNHDVNFRFDELLFQRPEGTLDHVLAVVCDFPESTGHWRSLVIPVRARTADGKLLDYFPQFENERAGNFSRGMIPSRHDHAKFVLKLDARRGAWPTDVAAATVPLWEPR